MLDDDLSKWPCGLIETTADGTIEAVNDTIVRWTGRARQELIGRGFRDLLSVGSRLFYETHIAPMVRLHGSAEEIALDLRTAGGVALSVLVNVASGRSGAEDHRYLSVVVATQRRSYERELLLARREAEAATAAAELAQDRLELAAEVHAAMIDGAPLPQMLMQVADVIARRRQSVCLIARPAGEGHDRDVAVGSPDPSSADTDDLVDRLFGDSRRPWPAWLRPNEAGLFAGPPDGSGLVPSDVGRMIIVPVRAAADQVATVILVRTDRQPSFDAADLADVGALSVGMGLRLENLRLSAAAHDRALSLQQALLTPTVRTDGLDIATT